MLVDPCVDPVAKQWNEGSTKKNTLSLLPVFKHNGSTARDRQSFINFNPVHGQGILCIWPVQCHNVDRTVRLRSMGDLRHGNGALATLHPKRLSHIRHIQYSQCQYPNKAHSAAWATCCMLRVLQRDGESTQLGKLFGISCRCSVEGISSSFPSGLTWDLWCNFMRV